VRLRIKKYIYNIAQTKFNMGLFRSKETQAAFKPSLSNWFQPPQELIGESETDI
jgi:hypothetical protein